MGGGPLRIDPLESAKRELKEETGLIADDWQELMKLHLPLNVPAFSSNPSSTLPLGPTKGRPTLFSVSPGASPTMMSSDPSLIWGGTKVPLYLGHPTHSGRLDLLKSFHLVLILRPHPLVLIRNRVVLDMPTCITEDPVMVVIESTRWTDPRVHLEHLLPPTSNTSIK